MLNTALLMRKRLAPKQWLSISYFTFFMSWGILIPFWGKFLVGIGFNNQQIGNMIAVSLIARSIGTFVVPLSIKHAGQLINSLKLLALLCLVSVSLFFFTTDWLYILLIMVIYNFLVNPCIPVTDSLSATWQKMVSFEYGRVRLWGSIGFIVSSTLMGFLIDIYDYRAILVCLTISHVIFFVTTFLKTSIAPTNHIDSTYSTDTNEPTTNNKTILIKLFTNSTTVLIFIAITLIQGSHSTYYNFAAIYWKDFGYNESLIGIFIAFAVFVEVLFFAYGHKMIARWKVRTLLQCCAFFCIIRWSMMASLTAIPFILIMQSLHAVTYVMGHMAMMRFISHHDAKEMIFLQSSYAALGSGVGLALFSAISGVLLDKIGANTFYVMAVVALIALVLVPKKIN